MGERYINLSDRQVKDTQNQSQDFLSIKTICKLLNNQDSKIADLEAKLAESKSKLRVSNSHLASSQLEYNQLKKEYDEQEKLLSRRLAITSELQFEFDQLKQQLAETDKLMQEYLSKCLSLEQQLAEKDKIEYTEAIKFVETSEPHIVAEELERLESEILDLEQSQNQTAIDELEKVLSKLSNIENTLINCGNGKEDAICWFANIIDQQIKNLKGEK